MPFSFTPSSVAGVVVVHPHVFNDHRGQYRKTYEERPFREAGIYRNFTETSTIISQRGTIRGLHYQSVNSQAKLVQALRGNLFDVALDLRPDSPTFGKYHVEYLNGSIPKAVFIPEGFAHGFLSLDDNTIFSYQCSGEYLPEYCGGILWNDPSLDIPWPLKENGISELVISEKDKSLPTFTTYLETAFGRDDSLGTIN